MYSWQRVIAPIVMRLADRSEVHSYMELTDGFYRETKQRVVNFNNILNTVIVNE